MRIRTIKPEFWASESMGRLSRDARLVFIGLWSLADDHGRFRADPRFIAGQLMPYDSDGAEVASRALASLREEGCIVLYEAERSQYGAVTGWKTHQKIDRPSTSRLPQPPENKLANIREPSTNPREPSCEEQGTGNREQGTGNREGPRPGAVESGALELSVQVAPDTVAELREAWNELTQPPIPRWSKGREREAKEALKRRPLEQWREVFARINASPFLRGEKGDWRADIDWALRPGGAKPEPALKVLEGGFDQRHNGRSPIPAESVDWTQQQTGEVPL